MLILQTPWSTEGDNTALTDALTLARRTGPDGAEICLLPMADGGPEAAVEEDDAIALLASLAETYEVFLAAAAYVTTARGAATVGWVLGPDGSVMSRALKVLPDLLENFTDAESALYQPAEFQIARTPLGQIGLVLGEDILSPHVVRGAVLSGAEFVLNPAREYADERLTIRLEARKARAYENVCYVASASPAAVSLGGAVAKLPSASMVADWWGVSADIPGDASFLRFEEDLDALRDRRAGPMANYPAVVRCAVYAPGYENEASKAAASPANRAEWQEAADQKASQLDGGPRYGVTLIQHVGWQAKTKDELMETRKLNLDAAVTQAKPIASNPGTKLILFPEFFLTNPVSPLGEYQGEFANHIGVSFPGPEMDALAQLAADTKTYVAGGVFEFDPDWPDRFFNTAFIIDDNGELIHRYRKIHCGDVFGWLADTTPGSVYSQYVDKYGYEHLFPVAETPLGNLCTAICFDMNFPETFRAMVKRGAEVILHPTSEPHNVRRRGWDIGRHVRAFENTAYVLTAGHGGELVGGDVPWPTARSRGFSKIVNFDGSLQVVADGPGRVLLSGEIDIAALRRARQNPAVNLAMWDDPIAYKHVYAKNRGVPNDYWADEPLVNPYKNFAAIKDIISSYEAEGVFVPPAAPPKAAE